MGKTSMSILNQQISFHIKLQNRRIHTLMLRIEWITSFIFSRKDKWRTIKVRRRTQVRRRTPNDDTNRWRIIWISKYWMKERFSKGISKLFVFIEKRVDWVNLRGGENFHVGRIDDQMKFLIGKLFVTKVKLNEQVFIKAFWEYVLVNSERWYGRE